MTYSLHPEATKELEEALAFYREQGGVGLARAFLAELSASLDCWLRIMALAHLLLGVGAGSHSGVSRIRGSIAAAAKKSAFLLLAINTAALAIGLPGNKEW